MTVSYTVIDFELGPVFAAELKGKLIAVTLGDQGLAHLTDYVKKRFKESQIVPSVVDAGIQLIEYFEGSRKSFDVELDMRGTDFQKMVWNALLEIPFGQTSTYGELAAKIGRPGAARAVGAACGANPIPLIVPCHRVLQSGGGLGGFSAGLHWKRRLLDHEKY